MSDRTNTLSYLADLRALVRVDDDGTAHPIPWPGPDGTAPATHADAWRALATLPGLDGATRGEVRRQVTRAAVDADASLSDALSAVASLDAADAATWLTYNGTGSGIRVRSIEVAVCELRDRLYMGHHDWLRTTDYDGAPCDLVWEVDGRYTVEEVDACDLTRVVFTRSGADPVVEWYACEDTARADAATWLSENADDDDADADVDVWAGVAVVEEVDDDGERTTIRILSGPEAAGDALDGKILSAVSPWYPETRWRIIDAEGDWYRDAHDAEDGTYEREHDAREAADTANHESAYGYPWANYGCFRLEHLDADTVKRAGFVVAYHNPTGEHFFGVDGGGYCFTSSHWLRLWLALTRR